MNDITELAQLVLHERRARDRSRWEEMRACFAPQAPLHPQRQHGAPSPARRTSAVKRIVVKLTGMPLGLAQAGDEARIA